MVSLKDLDALDRDGTFDKIRKNIENSTNNEAERLELLTRAIVTRFINFHAKKGKEDHDHHQDNFNKKKNKVSFDPRKKHKRSYRENSDEEEEISDKKVMKKRKRDRSMYSKSKKAEEKKPMASMRTESINYKEVFSNLLPNLPPDMRAHIERKGVDISNVKFVIVKTMFKTDLSEHHGRFTMPLNQVFSNEFLDEKDRRIMNSSKDGRVDVTVIEPCLVETHCQMKKWKMNNCWCYALISGWKRILKQRKATNGFIAENPVQVCWFRTDDDKKLWLTVNMVDPKKKDATDAGASTSQNAAMGEGSNSSRSTIVNDEEHG